MKIAHLLAQFLYENKELHLPGIGHFTLEESVILEPSKGKHPKPVELSGIQFLHDPQTGEDPKLIEYISAQSGKIKALSSADLYSHLELARQFMNIGKPFLLEGIGSITKLSSGEYIFTPGLALSEKAESVVHRPTHREELAEEPVSDYRGLLYVRKEKKTISRPLIILLLIAGIVAAVWGGYLIYKRSVSKQTKPEETATVPAKPEAQPMKPDSLSTNKDTTLRTSAPMADSLAPAVPYKIQLETAARERALSRYGKLKSWGWDIQMETADSLSFTLFIQKDIRPADTTRFLDSLSRAYGRRAIIVQ